MPVGISAEALTRRIDQFLGSRGYKSGVGSGVRSEMGSDPLQAEKPLDFVSEDDVRTALKAGKKLVVAERAIITPAARDLGEQHRVFTVAPWRG